MQHRRKATELNIADRLRRQCDQAIQRATQMERDETTFLLPPFSIDAPSGYDYAAVGRLLIESLRADGFDARMAAHNRVRIAWTGPTPSDDELRRLYRDGVQSVLAQKNRATAAAEQRGPNLGTPLEVLQSLRRMRDRMRHTTLY